MIARKLKSFRKTASRRKHPAGTHRKAFTIVEAMIAAAVTIIVALGTLCYQYHGVKHSRASQAQLIATRVGQLVLEDWKSTGGDPDYDPTELGLGFVDTTGSEIGNCRITLDNQSFYLSTQQNDIDQDTVAGVKLCQIRVTVKWRRDYASGATTSSDPEIYLTTYVRRDG